MGMGGGTVLLCTGQDSIWLESWFCYQKYFPKKLNKKKKSAILVSTYSVRLEFIYIYVF